MTASAPSSSARLCAPALLLCIAAAWYGQYRLQYGDPRAVGAIVLALALAAAFAILVRAEDLAAAAGDPSTGAPRRAVEWCAVTALVGLGVLFRGVHFDTIPEGLNHDAAWYGLYAIYINRGAPYTPYTAAGFGRETLFMYLVAPFVRWLGNTPEALQLASTLCGVAALVPLYLLARAMFGVRTALVALGFLAVSGWHGVFSRVGWRLITVPPLEMLALYAAWRAVQVERWRYWLAMGAAAALSLYTYNAARIVPVLAAVPYALHFPREGGRRRRYLLGGGAALAAFLVVGFPMLRYVGTHLDEFQRRASAVAEQRDAEGTGLVRNAWDALALFNYRGNGDDFFVDEPLLEPLAAVFFITGVAVALRRARRRPEAFLLIGLPIALLPAVWSVPNGNRAITAVPFVYLLVALGAETVARCVAAGVPLRGRHTVHTLLLCIAVAVAGVETYREFLSSQRRPMRGFSPGATAAALFMRRNAQLYAPHTVSEWADNAFLYLTDPGVGSPFEIAWPFGATLEEIDGQIDRRADKGLMFLLDFSPAADAALEQLAERYPKHRVELIPPPRGEGAAVARALLVEPDAVPGPWRNFSRSLSVRRRPGDPSAGALRCGRALGDSRGVSARASLMFIGLEAPMPVAHLTFWPECPPTDEASPLLTIAVNESGLIAETDRVATLLPWAELEVGRWYDIDAVVDAGERTARVRVAGGPAPVQVTLPVPADAAVEISGVDLRSEASRTHGSAIYLDDLVVIGGVHEAGDPAWTTARGPRPTSGGGVPPEAEPRDAVMALYENFEAVPPGSIGAAPGWQDVRGAEVADSPRAPRAHAAPASPPATASAFTGGAGTDAAEFREPRGVAVDARGNFYVTLR